MVRQGTVGLVSSGSPIKGKCPELRFVEELDSSLQQVPSE